MAINGSKVNPKRFHKNQIPFYLYLIPFAVFMGLPILFIINHAFKPMDELFAFPPRFFVTNPSLINFQNLFQNAADSSVPLSRYAFNSLIVTLAVVVFAVFFSSLAGFALSKFKFKLKGPFFAINNLALMFVPIAVTIPRYLTISAVGILNTMWAHILPLVAIPVVLFLIKQFIDQVPDSLLESAQIEGATSFQIYRKIVLPLVKPAIATGAILAFQQVWVNIETSSLFTSSENVRTLSFYMNTLTTVNTVQGQGMAAAAALFMFIPNLVLFIIMQSSVINTMAHSGLK
ncbi:MAG TPA: carbohydrate ABC transporter permease [Candidatus Limiplasma sp.]|nr:carbohydrate ABC transporter permease [Candidatus Limiplasma sp.]